MQDFTKLMVWRKSHELTVLLYKETRKFPKEEIFGLTGQMRRCARFHRSEHSGRMRARFQR